MIFFNASGNLNNNGGKAMTERLPQKQIEEYKRLCSDRDNGRMLTPAGLRFRAFVHEKMF